MHQLFKEPEKKDRFAPVDYDAMLKEFVDNPIAISKPATKDFPLDAHLETTVGLDADLSEGDFVKGRLSRLR